MKWELRNYSTILFNETKDIIYSIPFFMHNDKDDYLDWPNNANSCSIKDAYNTCPIFYSGRVCGRTQTALNENEYVG